MTHHVHGTFTVSVKPLTPPPAEGLGRYSIDKQIHGDLEATAKAKCFRAVIRARESPVTSPLKS